MKRIEILTDIKDPPGYLKGEIRFVSPEKAGYFCGLGWARDVSKEIPTGAPDTSEKTLEVQNVRHVTTTETIGS